MPDHNGPCRFGQYNRLQRIILDHLGFQDVPIVHPSNEDSYSGLIPGRGVRFRLAVWRGIIAVDILRKLLQERAPYETHTGESRAAYERHLGLAVRCIEHGGGGIGRVLGEAIRDFGRIEVRHGPRKPLVAIVGEIFMRDNPFCNGFVVQRLEELGAETVMSPIRDWISYSTYRFTRDAVRKGRLAGWAKSKLQGVFQKAIEERLVQRAEKGGVEMRRDIPLESMLDLCMPYIHCDYDGDPALALGSAAGQAGMGISGVASIMPFTCLPGTVVAAQSPIFSEDHDGIPWINIAYDGQEDASLGTRLQAFVYRAQEYACGKSHDRW